MNGRHHCLVLWLLLGAAPVARLANAQILRPGEPKTATAPATFSVPAESRQLLQVRVEQNRAAMLVQWLSPAGQTLAEAQNATLDEHALTISAIAAVQGEYRLKIQIPGTPASNREFSLTLSPLRPATPADVLLLTSESRYNEGIVLLAKPGATYARAAIEKFLECAKLWQGTEREPLAAYQLSEAYFLSGDAKTSLQWSTTALALYKQSNDPLGIATALNNQGVAHNTLGEPRLAIDCYTQALPFAKQLSDPFNYGNLLNSLGRAYSNLSENDSAIQYFRQSLEIWRQMNEIRWRGITLNNLGLAYRANGDLERARDSLQQALELRRSSRDLSGEATTITNLGLLDQAEGDLRTAGERFEQALALQRKLGNPRAIASAQHQLGAVYLFRGQLSQAESMLRASLEGRHATGDRIGEASSLLMLAKTYLRQGAPANAVEPLDQALAIARKIGAPLEEATILSTLARVRGALGETSSAIELAEASIQLHEAVRSSIADPQSRARYMATVRDQYDTLTSLLVETKNATAAFESSERTHARSLLDLLEEAKIDFREGVDPRLLATERELQTALVKLNPGGGTNPKITATLRQLSDTQAEIRRNSPALASLGRGTVPPASEIQRDILDAGTALLEFTLGDDRSYAWLMTRDSLTSYVLPARAEIESLAKAAYAALSVTNSSQAPLEALSRVLLGPLATALNTSRLAIVADGSLLQIPFSALTLPGTRQPLATRIETVYVPSAAVLASLRKNVADRQPPTRIAAIFADPVFRADDSRVPAPRPPADPTGPERLYSSRAEAATLAALLPGADVRLDFAARRDYFELPDITQYRLLHLATHSVLNSRRPDLSGVTLSLVDPAGRPRNGFLALHEISRLKLHADLVVLSACETALGREIRGEGLVGLSRAFLFAGSPRVIASLWKVPDRPTAELMKHFYTAMVVKKMRPAQALRTAQLQVRAEPRWAHPYYWAGFVLQGDWR